MLKEDEFYGNKQRKASNGDPDYWDKGLQLGGRAFDC